jgi:hypothetical protein
MHTAPCGGWQAIDEVQGAPASTGVTAPPSGRWQAPATQRLPGPHGVQAEPPVPQARSLVPASHCPFWQQPVGHVVALHGGGVPQAPLRHDWPMGHMVQAWPPAPQAKRFCCEAVTQTPFTQQPLQVPGPQGGAWTHAPLVHAWPMGHMAQACPRAPQAKRLCCEAVTQKSLVQQPAHVIGPHGAMRHVPFTHCSPKPQVAHMALGPPTPHANCESPG